MHKILLAVGGLTKTGTDNQPVPICGSFFKIEMFRKAKRKQLWIIPTRLEKISCAADHRWTYKIRENKAGKTAVGRWEEAVLSSLGA
jgi:hypothetical protein